MRAARAGYAVAFGLVLGGCATILGGTSQTLTVNANVDGAEVLFNDSVLGTTPLTASLKRGEEGVLRVRAEGYQPYQIAMNREISSLFWVNIFSGGAFGSTTDYATGAMYEYEPSTYMVTLQPAEQTPEERQEWERRERLRGFVLLNNEALVSDLASGSGEYVDVLIDALSVRASERTRAIERWRTTYQDSRTAAEFAETIVAELAY